MATALLAMFLMAHGLVHLAIWLPRPKPDASAPFVPDHSGILTAVDAPVKTTRRLAATLTGVAAGAFVITGIGVAFSAPWTPAVAVAASLAGLTLKILYFHPWLTAGVLIDLAVLSAALTAWPIGLF
jgi:hypothetical protein